MKHLAIYGVGGGVLIVAMRFVEYRFLVLSHSFEIYAALIAATFAAIGIWFGLTITGRKVEVREVTVEVPVPAATGPFVARDTFVVRFDIDVTFKPTGKRMEASEVGIYTLKDGKVVREEFLPLV